MKLIKNYRWKKLTEDGLLREPKQEGPHYDYASINGYDGFESEEEAMTAMLEFNTRYKYSDSNHLVLITTYIATEN